MGIKLSEDDYKLIDEVLEDYNEYGRTNKVCLHCGKPMKYIENGSSYEVRCETDNCIRAIFRGI